jgi:hypothetical protein
MTALGAREVERTLSRFALFSTGLPVLNTNQGSCQDLPNFGNPRMNGWRIDFVRRYHYPEAYGRWDARSGNVPIAKIGRFLPSDRERLNVCC